MPRKNKRKNALFTCFFWCVFGLGWGGGGGGGGGSLEVALLPTGVNKTVCQFLFSTQVW